MRAVHLGYPANLARALRPCRADAGISGARCTECRAYPLRFEPAPSAGKVDRPPRLLEAYPHPRRLFLIGGPTLYWQLPVDRMVGRPEAAWIAEKGGGSVIAVGSPRSRAELLAAIAHDARMLEDGVPVRTQRWAAGLSGSHRGGRRNLRHRGQRSDGRGCGEYAKAGRNRPDREERAWKIVMAVPTACGLASGCARAIFAFSGSRWKNTASAGRSMRRGRATRPISPPRSLNGSGGFWICLRAGQSWPR